MSVQYGDTSGDLSGQTGGDQTLIGTDGEPNGLYGDAGGIFFNHATGGNDTLIGGSNSFYDDVYGDAFIMSDSTGGSDTITGGVGSVNKLAGDAFEMVASTGGNDTITGGANSTNSIWGDAWIMLSSTGGNDKLTGSGGQRLWRRWLHVFVHRWRRHHHRRSIVPICLRRRRCHVLLHGRKRHHHRRSRSTCREHPCG